MSLSKTLKGLHWDQVPNDNDDEVAARGILYLLIFQQLGQLVRWSWGYHVLLAPKDKFRDHMDEVESRIEDGQAHYTDNPDQTDPDELLIRTRTSEELDRHRSHPSAPHDRAYDELSAGSGEETPVTDRTYLNSQGSLSPLMNGSSKKNGSKGAGPLDGDGNLPHGTFFPHESSEGEGQILSFPTVETPGLTDEDRSENGDASPAWRGGRGQRIGRFGARIRHYLGGKVKAAYRRLPVRAQRVLSATIDYAHSFLCGLWAFMNPPLWAMLVSIIVASVPSLQSIFFTKGSFVRNSFTRAMDQNGQVAVPLILVVLGANLARNTLPEEAKEDMEDPKEERKLLIASLVARMLLPTIIMAPVLALVAKYVPVSILDDPIFVIVCFLLTGAPSALQLAQICQINNVYVGAMSKLLFQSYVVW